MQHITQPSSITAIKTSLPPLIFLTHKIETKTHFQNPIISAKWGKKRSGSQKSQKLIIESIAFVASNLKILPDPLDSLVREFWVAGGNGGNGRKSWFRNGFGGGDGRNKRRENLGFWVPLMISCGLAMWVVLEREKDSDLLIWVFLVVCAFAVCFILKGWKREIKDWILGFSCGAAMMGFGLKNNENFVRWVRKSRVSFSNGLIIAKKRRKSRWI